MNYTVNVSSTCAVLFMQKQPNYNMACFVATIFVTLIPVRKIRTVTTKRLGLFKENKTVIYVTIADSRKIPNRNPYVPVS